jgi:addiction module RelE/StbE family toxin
MDKIAKILWTENGSNSFEEIVQYIAKDSPHYAGNFAKKILSSIENLEHFPEIGRIVPEYNRPDLREIIYQNYRIVYKIVGDAIYIALVVHGCRNIQDFFAPSSIRK